MLHQKTTLNIDDKQYLVSIYVERRNGTRVSITNKGINIRIADYYSNEKKNDEVRSCLKWAREKIIQKLAKVSIRPPYAHGSIFHYGDIDFTLFFVHSEKGKNLTCKLNLENHEIIITFNTNTATKIAQKNIGSLLSKLMAAYFTPKIDQRIRAFNDLHFKKKITDVSMRNTSSRWGSCSSKGSINISTRLLFAPQWVVDYVLIHELCHLIHMDHSDKFWALVKSIIPHYEQAEKHLHEKGGGYNF
ncbi:MAG: M48 family metallopeptidase [Bacteroidetes bacterium]|nr:M48 family metallopeptidase [Bacteroidota bacterium]